MNLLNPQRLITRFEARIRQAHLPIGITWWNGRKMEAANDARVHLIVRTPAVFPSLLRPTLGSLARLYVEQQIDLDGDPRELTAVGEQLGGAPDNAHAKHLAMKRWFMHSRVFDRKAIQFHYDLSDDFFGIWLDARRVYSCAYFREADDTLDRAQEQKLDHICRKLRLQPGERFLDIGCGWGALVMWAAQNYGVRATGITLSENQHAYASFRIREAGLQDRCEVRILDYRDIAEDEPYDKIASVGMFEHVGRKNLPIYFAKIQKLLKPGGLVMNHGITLNRPGTHELGSDIGRFIDQYVFPGGELTHVSHVLAEMSAQGLEPADVESLRPHYAKTLWHWVDRLESKRASAIALVGEKAYRIWRIYMAGSAHAFERGWLSLHQILAGRPDSVGRLGLPLTREFIYKP